MSSSPWVCPFCALHCDDLIVPKVDNEKISNKYVCPYVPEDYTSSWAQYTILSESPDKRNSIIEYLSSKDIPSMIYYRIPLHLQKVMERLEKGDYVD